MAKPRRPISNWVEETPGLRAYLSLLGTAGGKASGASRREDRLRAEEGNLDAGERVKQRSELARKAAQARWERAKPNKK